MVSPLVLLVAAIVAAASAVAPCAEAADGFSEKGATAQVDADPTPMRLSVGDRTLFAEYRMLERERVPVIFALRPARTATAAAALGKRGAEVIGRRDSIGYLYALVPIDAVNSLLELDGLQALQLTANPARTEMGAPSQSTQAEPATPQSGAATAQRQPRARGTPPSSELGADNPFTAEAVTQALAFKAQHPTFDGRGVTTAFVEPAAPNLSTLRGALDLSGRALPKFVHYDLGAPVSVSDPVADGYSIWQRTEPVAPDADGMFIWRERTYRLPADFAQSQIATTQWRMCRRLPAAWETHKEEYDVLWAVDRDKVWVLPKSAGADFSEARSASLSASLSWVQVGEPADWRANASAVMAFVFKADRQRHWLGFGATYASHGGMVGSVMAGSGLMGSEAHGVAPAAQLSIYIGAQAPETPSYTGIERMLAMLSDPTVDVAQASWSVGDTSRFGAATPHRLWGNRLVRQTGKPFVKAAGNFGARLFGSDEFTMAEEVFAVGAYTPRATWLANLGIAPQAEHTLASYSGYGPAKDGGLKPDFLALTHTLSEGHGWRWYWADTPGYEEYAVSGGTSAAAPNGAGHVALLVSAAKQTGVPHDAARLRAAIATSAKFLDGVEARAQGHGLIQVSDAWTALQRAKSWRPASFAIQAPLVGAETRAGGPDRFIGRGLFELSGWRPGQTGRRELLVTRTGGAGGSDRYRLRWKGDTQVFGSEQREIELPLGEAVSIPVQIEVGASGSYSAILDLIDPVVDLIAGSVLCTVMVADPLLADGANGVQYTREAPRPGNSLFYVDVPAGLSALTVQLTKDDGKSFWYAQDPTGRRLPFNTYGLEVKSEPTDLKAREQQFRYPDPVPGIWQLHVRNAEPHSMEDLEAVDWSRPMPLGVQIQGWAASADPVSTSPATSQPTEVVFHNRLGTFEASIQAVGLGATRTAEVALSPGLTPAFFEVRVDPGATKLEVQFEHAATDAQVGLYVYKVPEGERRETTLARLDHTALIYHDPSFQPRKRHTIAAPMPGRYRIALDPIRVPDRGVTVVYRDTVYHPLYGAVEVTDIPGTLRAGDSRAAKAAVLVRARPADGRKLLAEVGLFNDSDREARFAVATQTWFIEP